MASVEMKNQWEIIFHDDFIPEYRELSESVQDVLVALTTILREKACNWDGRRSIR